MATRRTVHVVAWFLAIVLLTAVDSLAAQISVQEFRERVQRGDSFLLIDVREPWEHEEFNLGGQLIPLGQLEAAIPSKLDPSTTDEIVLYDRSGNRAGQAQMFMMAKGFSNVRHLTGGTLAWIEAFGTERPQPQPGAPATPVPPLPEPAPPDESPLAEPEEAGADPQDDVAVAADDTDVDEIAADDTAADDTAVDDTSMDDDAADPVFDEEQGEDDGTADDQPGGAALSSAAPSVSARPPAMRSAVFGSLG